MCIWGKFVWGNLQHFTAPLRFEYLIKAIRKAVGELKCHSYSSGGWYFCREIPDMR